MSIQEEAQSLSQSAPISLFTIDATKSGGPLMHFVMGSERDGVVTYNGIDYQPVDVQFDGLETSGAGALPTPLIRISNIDSTAQALVNTYGDMTDCILYRVRTFERFLDSQPDADPEAYYGPDVFRFERKTSENEVYIEWELSAAIDQEGKKLPGRTAIRATCLWRYRYYNESNGEFDYSKAQCPYTGDAYYDINDLPVDTAAEDVPSRNLSCCKLRFGSANPLPFGGFIGLQRSS